MNPFCILLENRLTQRRKQLNTFVCEGVVEGVNNKLKLITRKSYGFRTQEACENTLCDNLGDFPESEFTHRFF